MGADIDVKNAGNGEAWSFQIHVNKEGLDNSKAYAVTVKSGDTVVFEDVASSVTEYRKTINLAGKLALGKATLTLTVE